MSFPLVHFVSKLFLFNTNGTKILSLINTNNYSDVQSDPTNSCEIDVDYSFSNQSTPSTTDITIHNLTKRDFNKFKKDYSVSIYAGWIDSDWTESNIRHIFTSTISTVNPIIDSAGDWQMSISCQDGNKYSNETALSKIYKSRSESIRKNSSLRDLTLSNRRYIKQIEHKYGIRGNKLESIKNALGPKEKSAKAKLMSEYQLRHGKRGSGVTAYNKIIRARRKAARSNITKEFKSARAALEGKRKANTRQKRITIRRVRTHNAAQRQKQRKAIAKQKKSSKKTSSSGIHFKKNTMGSTIIRRLAEQGHITISQMKLVKNHRFTSGYTATKTPWQEIQTVAKDYCNSNIWWPHGNLYIGNFANHKVLPFTLTPSTGMIQSPEPQTDDDSDDDSDTSTQTMNKKQIAKQQRENAIAHPTTYEVTCIFLPFVTTGSTFRIVDPDKTLPTDLSGEEQINRGSIFDNEVTVESGNLTFGSGSPSCTLDVVITSDLMKQQQQSDSQKALAAKQNAQKDSKKRRKIRIKRARRAHVRRMGHSRVKKHI